MAFKKNFEYKGVQVTNGYLKIVNITGDKNRVVAILAFSVDANNDALYTEQFDFVPSMDSGNFIKQAYEYIKTLNGYQDAVDC